MRRPILGDAAPPVALRQHFDQLEGRLAPGARRERHGHPPVAGDSLPEEAQLVHATGRFHEELAAAEVQAARDLGLVEPVEEEEGRALELHGTE